MDTSEREAMRANTLGELAAIIRRHGIVSLRGAFLLAQLDATDGHYVEAYKACGEALKPFAEAEDKRLKKIVESMGPEELADAPQTLLAYGVRWERVRWSGNPPHAEVVFGWRVKLNSNATGDEKAWFHRHGFRFSGGRWGRPDGGFKP